LLEESGLPPINIICQKVANQGLTRFEDRRRLPLGISVNFNSMAAKLLTQVGATQTDKPQPQPQPWPLHVNQHHNLRACGATCTLCRLVLRQQLIELELVAGDVVVQVAVNPMSLPVLAKLGGAVEYGIVDASEYCRR
jgi:hypothetical protein